MEDKTIAIKDPTYKFRTEAGLLINSGTSRSIVLHGNIHDIFFISDEDDEDYIPLVSFLTRSWDIPGYILIVYELNGPLRFLHTSDREKVKNAFNTWRGDAEPSKSKTPTHFTEPGSLQEEGQKPINTDDTFEQYLNDAIGSPTLALELLRQFCLISRSTNVNGERLLDEKLLILIEATDMLLPEGEIRTLSLADRHRISIIQDWVSDSEFMKGTDTVVFVAESKSLVNSRITRLPQVVDVEIQSPDVDARRHFISWFNRTQKAKQKELNLWGSQCGIVITGITADACFGLLFR